MTIRHRGGVMEAVARASGLAGKTAFQTTRYGRYDIDTYHSVTHGGRHSSYGYRTYLRSEGSGADHIVDRRTGFASRAEALAEARAYARSYDRDRR
jgi:hypothetical protein